MKRSFLLITLVAFAYLIPNLATGGIMIPLDILHNLPPFSASVPLELQKVRNPHLSDLVSMIYPWTDLFSSGEAMLPLWNPYSFCGSPLVASAQTGLLFPISLLYKGFSLEFASLGVALAKLVFCGAFAFLYYRKLNFNQGACLLGSFSYTFGGQIITWLGYPGSFPILTLPFVFWSIEKYLSMFRLRDACWISVAYGLLFLGSQPQFGFVVALASALYFFARTLREGPPRIRTYASFMAAALLGLCLASPQILPFLEYLRESAAYQVRGTYGWKQYPWYTLVSWVVPRFFGDPREGNFWGFSSFLGEAVFIGGAPLIFASIALWFAGKNHVQRAILTLCVFALLGLYVPYAQWLFQQIPLLRNIDNNKLVVLLVFGVASLAASGFDSFLRQDTERGKYFKAWITALTLWMALVLAVAWFFRSPIDQMGLAGFESREIICHSVILALSSIALLTWKTRLLPPNLVGAALLLLSLSDLFRVWMNYYPSFPSRYLHPRSTSVEFLRQNLGQERFIGLDGLLPPETSILFRLQDARGIEGLTPFRHFKLMGKIDPQVQNLLTRLRRHAPDETRWTSSTLFYRSIEKHLNSADPRVISDLSGIDYWSSDIRKLERPHLLSILSVRYVLAPKESQMTASTGFRLVHSSDADVWENPGALTRAFICTRPMFEQDEDRMLQTIADPAFPFRNSALIAATPDALPMGGERAEHLPAKIIRQTPHLVEVLADSTEGGWLVLNDLFYPGWRAYVDESPSRIHLANYIFRAVKVPKGHHRIRFVFRPTSFFAGLILSSLALVALLCIGFRRHIGSPNDL